MSASHDLNPAQQAAVEHRDGPLLVLAGPGSGKTRVITRRIARLMDSGVYASRILALTFTNKAAREMEERVAHLVPGSRVWVSTFHRFCAQLLRRYGAAVGLQPNFTILDSGDQGALMREVLSEQNIDSSHFSPGKLLGRISRSKSRLQSPEEFSREVLDGRQANYFDQVAARVYQNYQDLLLRANSVDFDDLLCHVGRLLADSEVIRQDLGERYRYILVDEYQDTNFAQYQIVRMLASQHRNLCVTGDPDQSIYGWRGAELGNILQFEQDFPEARVVRLEMNYRSTQAICRAADALIANNVRRKPKTLFTENDEGHRIESLFFDDQHLEAEGVATLIRQIAQHEGRAWSDFAIFYRVNALSRPLELALGRHRIPYQVAAGLAFYERAEVKDLLAYFRLIANPADRLAFQRVVNTPVRGIGKTTIARLLDWADQQGLAPLEAARQADQFPGLTRRATLALGRFVEIIDRLSKTPFAGVTPLFDELLKQTGYAAGLDKHDETDLQRLANIEELRTAAAQYDQEHAADPTLLGFLENSSLVADLDSVDESSGKVTLMTLHAAKGLEFPVVFIAAVEEGLLPHDRSLRSESPNEIEEERRLMFVGVTRARERLLLTRTWSRDMRGQRMLSAPSRFLEELSLPDRSRAKRANSSTADPESPDESASRSRGPQRLERGGRLTRPETQATPGEEPETPGYGSPARSRELALEALELSERTVTAVNPASPPQPAPRSPEDLARSQATLSRREAEALEAKRRRQSKLGGIPHLTTGAALLSGTNSEGGGNAGLRVGMSVRHPQLGVGEIVEASGEGKRQTVVVRFPDGSERSFLTQKAPLQPVGLR